MMRTAEILSRIPRLRALVIGDICLDRWCKYDPNTAEPSRETGIPRIGVVSTEVTPGAAGTVANNLIALGAGSVAVLGAIGDDGFGYELRQALAARGITHEMAVIATAVPTFTYTKLINLDTDVEDLPRVDFIFTEPMPQSVDRQICERLRVNWDNFDVVLVSDQAETDQGGIVTPAVRTTLGQLARQTPGKVVWVDSRMRGEQFRDVLLKCNAAEAEQACKRLGESAEYQVLRAAIGGKPLIVTQGERGALIVDGEERLITSTPVAHPVDICGAGDSFSAGGALALAITGSPDEAARFGNLVSSVTIMKKGTGTASPAELLEADTRR